MWSKRSIKAAKTGDSMELDRLQQIEKQVDQASDQDEFPIDEVLRHKVELVLDHTFHESCMVVVVLDDPTPNEEVKEAGIGKNIPDPGEVHEEAEYQCGQ